MAPPPHRIHGNGFVAAERFMQDFPAPGSGILFWERATPRSIFEAEDVKPRGMMSSGDALMQSRDNHTIAHLGSLVLLLLLCLIFFFPLG